MMVRIPAAYSRKDTRDTGMKPMAVVSSRYMTLMPKKASTIRRTSWEALILRAVLVSLRPRHSPRVMQKAVAQRRKATCGLAKPESIKMVLKMPMQELQRAARSA